MARYTFGGDIHDLIARPDANAGGALKPAPGATIQFFAAATGGTVITDYLVDSNGDGSFETSDTSVVVRSTGYLPDFQGPDGIDVLYYDPDPGDADVRRVRYVARDSGTGGLPSASTSAAGIVEYADATELATGTATNRVTSVADVTSKVNAHANATNPHSVYGDAIDAINDALLTKPSVNTEGVLPLDDLPVSTTGEPGKLVGYRSDGSAGGVSSSAADAYLPRAEVERIVSANLVAGGDVRALAYAPGTPLGSTSATTFTTIPTVVVTDAATSWRVRCEYDIVYRGTTAAGIQVRHKTGTATPTNRATNPSMEDPLNVPGTPDGYSTAAAITRSNDATTFTQGTQSMKATVTGAGTGLSPALWSDFVPYTPGEVMSLGVDLKRSGATVARNARFDVQFGDATADNTLNTGVISTTLGTSTAVGTTYSKFKTENVSHATATKIRWKIVFLSVSNGDIFNLDANQIEPGATLPAFGSTGGSGSSAITFTGRWGPGLTNAATTTDNYSKLTSVRAASNTLTQHGALGTTTDAFLYGSFEATVGGTGLINQRLELEFAQRVQDATTGNETKIMAVNATFARIA